MIPASIDIIDFAVQTSGVTLHGGARAVAAFCLAVLLVVVLIEDRIESRRLLSSANNTLPDEDQVA